MNPVIAPHTCSYCQRILLDLRQSVAYKTKNPPRHSRDDHTGAVDPRLGWESKTTVDGFTRLEVEYAASLGCVFSQTILSDVLKWTDEPSEVSKVIPEPN